MFIQGLIIGGYKEEIAFETSTDVLDFHHLPRVMAMNLLKKTYIKLSSVFFLYVYQIAMHISRKLIQKKYHEIIRAEKKYINIYYHTSKFELSIMFINFIQRNINNSRIIAFSG